jgi:broad specificity phosphatase PhoE
MKLKNNYFILRHGYSLANFKGIASCWPEKQEIPLTEKGIKQINEVVKKIKLKKIDLIFHSDLLRTKQTAQIVGQALKIKPEKDERLREVNVGILNGQEINKIGEFWQERNKLSPLEHYEKRFHKAPPQGETYFEIEKRLKSFLKEQELKHQKKNILIVSHGRPLGLLEKIVKNYDLKKFVKRIIEEKEIETGELRKLN